MDRNYEPLNEHLSLAIALWAMDLPSDVTHEQRQQLHMDILKALESVGAIEKI